MWHLGRLPSEWRLVNLGDVAEIVMGQSPPGLTVLDWDGERLGGGGLPFIQGNAEFGSEHPEPQKWCTRPLKVAEHGDTLISVRAPVGETSRANDRVAIGRGLAAIRFTRANPDYGWHIVNHARREFQRVAQGSTFQAVGRDEVRGLPIAIPPVSEQRTIAAVLDAIDEAIERTEAVISATERLRDSLLHELLTRGVPGWHTTWREVPRVGRVPTDWEVTRLGDVCEPPQYGAVSPARAFNPSLPRYIRITDLTEDGRLRTDDPRSADPSAVVGYELRADDLLFARSGATVGKTYLYTPKDGPCVYAGYLIRFRIKPEFAVARFIDVYTRSTAYRRWVSSMLRAGAQPNINATEYASLPIPLPPLSEQLAIVAVFDAVDAAVECGGLESTRLRSFKVAIAHALLNGRLRPRPLD